MKWIIENSTWIFSGIGVTILVLVFNFLFGKKEKPNLINYKISTNSIRNAKQTNTNNLNNTNNINISIPKVNTLPIKTLELTKDSIQILFIDDEKFKTVENLISAGWINTKTIGDVRNLDSADVKNSDVIFVDINGIGESLFPKDKGLGLAEALKKKFPNKYIVIYSAQEQGDRFHKALKIVDNFLSKNAEPYEFINILENLIQ